MEAITDKAGFKPGACKLWPQCILVAVDILRAAVALVRGQGGAGFDRLVNLFGRGIRVTDRNHQTGSASPAYEVTRTR